MLRKVGGLSCAGLLALACAGAACAQSDQDKEKDLCKGISDPWPEEKDTIVVRMPEACKKVYKWARTPVMPALRKEKRKDLPARDRRNYFGHIEAPCHSYSEVKDGNTLVISMPKACREMLANMTELDSCAEIGKPCYPANELMYALFNTTYHETFPDFIFYLEQKEAGKFRKHHPVLIWQGENTPYLFGVRDVFAIVFSERPACIDVHVTAEFKSEPNPFSGLFTVIGKDPSPKPPAGQPGTPEQRIRFYWRPLSGVMPTKTKVNEKWVYQDLSSAGPWFAVARAGVDPNTTNRVTVGYNPPKPPAKPAADAKPAAAAAPAAEPLYDPCAAGKDEDEAPSGNFIAANGFFSNSPDSQVTVALALGLTWNVKNTSVSVSGSEVNINGYGLFKWYPLKSLRPRLKAGVKEIEPSWSLGLVLGTNIVNSPFDEIVFGISIGHLLGNTGITLGVNSVEGAKDTNEGRKQRAFFGIDYSF